MPIALSFGHEMNGNWYPWGTAQTTAAEFVAAWRHIHDVFARAGATNVIWVWNPNVINPVPEVPLKPLWPGNALRQLGRHHRVLRDHRAADLRQALYQPTIDEIRQFTGKPVHHRRDRDRDRPGRGGLRQRACWTR